MPRPSGNSGRGGTTREVESPMAQSAYTPAVPESTLSDLQRLVVRVTRKRPELAERAMKAALLLAAGHVTPLGDGRFRVVGSDTYSVDQVGQTCSCPDLEHGATEIDESKWCKHLLATLMLTYLAERSVSRDSHQAAFDRPAVCVDCGVLCRCGAEPNPPRAARVPLLARFQSA